MLLIVLTVLLSYSCRRNSVRLAIVCEVSSDSLPSSPISHAFCTLIKTITVRLEHGFVISRLNSCNYLFLKMVWEESKNFQGCTFWPDCFMNCISCLLTSWYSPRCCYWSQGLYDWGIISQKIRVTHRISSAMIS